MAGGTKHYFIYGNTAQGFIRKADSNLIGIKRLFILKGRPGTGKALMNNGIADVCVQSGFEAEYLHCPSAPETFDGIILPQISLAVLDGTDLHAIDLQTSFSGAWFIDTDTAFDRTALLEAEERASALFNRAQTSHEKAFECFSKALRVHDEWENIYIENMDFKEADALAEETIKLLLGRHRRDKTSVIKDRFFGAGTPSGALDYIDSLTGGLAKRYLLKGRPGTGKSTLLKKLADASSMRGLDIELYHCAFDSNSLDMILWPELDLCLFDSTAPHLYQPSRPNDDVIDMYARCVRPGTDEKYASILSDITARYKDAVQRGTAYLHEAKLSLDELTTLYSGLIKQEALRRLKEDLQKQLDE